MTVKKLREELKYLKEDQKVFIGFDDGVNHLIYTPLKLVGADSDGCFLFNDEKNLKIEGGEL